MTESFICKDYRFDNAVFSGVFQVPEGFEPQKVYFKDIKNDRYCYDVSYGPGDNADEFYISVDCDSATFHSGTWHPVMEGNNGKQYFFFCKSMKNEKKLVKMLKLSKDTLFFDASERYHYMAALDGDSRFTLRKLRNKAKSVKKTYVYIKSYEKSGMKVRFNLMDNDLKPAKQAELWFWNKNIKEVYRITLNSKDINNLGFEVDFTDFYNKYGKKILKQWDVFLACNRNGAYYQSRIVLKDDKKYANNVAIQSSDDSDRYIFNQPDTDSEGVVLSAFQMFFDGILRLCVKTVRPVYMYRGIYRECVETFSMNDGILNIRLRCMNSEFSERKLVIRHRLEESAEENGESICIYEPTRVENIIGGEEVTFTIDCNSIKWAPPRYEIVLFAVKDKNEYEFRLVGSGKKFEKLLTSVYKNIYTTDEEYLVYPTRTISGKIVMECRQKSRYDLKKYRTNEKIATVLYFVLKPFYKCKKNFLFFEKFCTAAQDNAYYMFKYFVHRKNMRIRPLYIIEKDRPVYKELKAQYGRRIIDFMSIRHLIYLQASDLFISTDSKRHCYKWHAGSIRILNMLNNKKSVFLQHGVLGFKRVDNIYGKQYANRADLFIASSKEEKDIITRYFGYDKKEVVVTGLARWDKLVSSPKNPPEIFYMPTWRNWITELSDEEFVKTDYFKSYAEILNSDRLSEILEKNNLYMLFCFHPKFRNYMHLINVNGKRIKMVSYDDDIRINKLLMECSMFITDYSSASWDVYYMDKPVLFYQFDYDKYNERQGSYINMERGLSSDRVTDFESFINKFSEIAAGGFVRDAASDNMIAEHLPAHRGGHRKKIYEEIINRFL